MTTMVNRLKEIVEGFLSTDSRLTFLTGAGISAESNIPTFRVRRAIGASDQKTIIPRRWLLTECSKTGLKKCVVSEVFHSAKPIIDINIEQSPFSVPAVKSGGIFIKETSTNGLNKLLETFRALF
jgi:hypothetical protein